MTVFTRRGKNRLVALAAFALLYFVWKLLAAWMGSSIILPGPEETAAEAFRLAGGPGFWRALGATLFRGILGFSVSFVLGLAVGFPAGRYPLFARFIKPYMTIIRSTPVLAIILIALVWFPAEGVPVFAAVLMAFPVVTQNVAGGIRAVDPSLVEMAKVYKAGKRRMLGGLYLPALLPFLASGASSALGLAWRVVVAAEVLSQPVWGIGAGMQEAKLRLETPRVFAWTLAALAISWLTDAFFSRLLGLLRKRRALG
jgi:NitT/TauT family transport system permease protein